MTTPNNADQPAHPFAGEPGEVYLGVTKREWFAGMAVQHLNAIQFSSQQYADGKNFITTAATWAVELADALLAELEKKP